MKNAYKILVTKFQGESPLPRRRLKLERNIKKWIRWVRV